MKSRLKSWGIPVGAATALAYGWWMHSPSGHAAEILGNAVMICGALLIASGAVLSKGNRDYLFKIKDQKLPDMVSRRELLELKIRLYELEDKSRTSVSGVVSAGPDTVEAKSELSKFDTAKPLTLTQKNLASLFIEASEKTGAGTVLVVAGALILVVNLVVTLVTDSHQKTLDKVSNPACATYPRQTHSPNSVVARLSRR